jgi:hypothetical protein
MFDGVIVEDTFVLGWSLQNDQLVFDVEVGLLSRHPEYEAPKAGEWTCYKPARLVFDQVRTVDGLPDMTVAKRFTDADGTQDYGSLSELTTEPGGYRIVGDFGTVLVQGGCVTLKFNRGKKEDLLK